MKESSNPEKIQKEYSTGNLGKINATESLISLIESSEDTEIRVRSIKMLKKINFQSEKVFKTLENHLISDESAVVRTSAANYLIHNFLENSISALRWVIQYDKSPLVLKLLFNCLKKFRSSQLKLIKKDLNGWIENFSSKIGVDPQESKFFLDLEVLFAKGKRNYEIDPLSYKHFQTLSDTKNGEPWLIINDKHVEILNFNYFYWKFIKNNTDIINSLNKLYDLEVYLWSLKKYCNKDDVLSAIPESIGFLTHLKKLILRRNDLYKLPNSMKKLSLLKELDLSYNKFNKIPQVLISLNSLKRLNIKHNFVQNIPKALNANINVIR